jgi:hypothetical protein
MASNAWGQLSWSAGQWGDQPDINQVVTSPSALTIAQGQANYSPGDGWGRNNWGALGWGVNYANNSVSLNSFPLTLTLGDETAAGEINSGWGRYTWGSFAWGITGSLLVTGQQLNTSLNSVSLSITGNIPVTGQQLNTSLNSVQAFGLAIVNVTGQQLTITEGVVDPSPDAIVTGQQLTTAQGSVTISTEINSGWGRRGWGIYNWGNDNLSIATTITGQLLSISQGDETASAGADVIVSSTANVGWGVLSWGAQGWGQGQVNLALTVTEGVVDPSPDATVTGIGMDVTLGLGTVVVGTGNVTVTGQELTIAKGSVVATPNTIASPTGKQLTTSVGSVFAGGTSIIPITGIGLTVRLNNINIQSWTVINTGTDATWIEVDTAA